LSGVLVRAPWPIESGSQYVQYQGGDDANSRSFRFGYTGQSANYADARQSDCTCCCVFVNRDGLMSITDTNAGLTIAQFEDV
jgi:hypothetical protein